MNSSYDRTALKAADFNRLFVPGWPVVYRPLLGGSERVPARLRSLAWELGSGEPVVKITGKAGGVSIAHISTLIESCPRKCGDCIDAQHHWHEDTVPDPLPEPEEYDLSDVDRAVHDFWTLWKREDPRNAAPVPVCPSYWGCKHCDFWLPLVDWCEECEGPADGDGKCVCWHEHHE